MMGAIAGSRRCVRRDVVVASFRRYIDSAGADVRIDSHVLLFTAAVSVFAGVFFGLAPAGHLGLHDLRSALNDSGGCGR